MRLKINGIHAVTTALKRKGEAIEQQISSEVMKQTANIELEATSNKPKGVMITSDISRLTGLVYAGFPGNDNIAAYYEFGTGAKVKIPQGLEEYAMQFYVNGEGRLPASPYLFPAYFKYRTQFLANCRKIVKSIV